MNRGETIHGSAVLLGEHGILIRGASGAGKSMLVVELLTVDPNDARLVADDQVILTAAHGRLLADVPDEIAGLIEMRGIGLVRLPYVAPVVIRLVVDLMEAQACPRMPEDDEAQAALEGVVVPRFCLPIGSDGAAARLKAAAAAILRPGG